jgi:hypothetical protein
LIPKRELKEVAGGVHLGHTFYQRLFMKKLILLLFILTTTMTASFAQKTTAKNGKMLRHVVLFKFKESSTPEDVKTIEDAFRALPSKIKEIKGYEWGLNNSPENLNQGFTHCFFLTFNSEEGRAAYLPHPAHKAFGALLGPHLDKVLVVDYWVKK